MKNVTKLFAVIFAVGLFCTLNLSAQENEKSGGSVKGFVINNPNPAKSKRSEAELNLNNQTAAQNSLIFCWSADDNTAASYKLKVWQLKQGQTAETAMQSNQIIVTSTQHAINTKGTGHQDRTTTGDNSEAIKVCSENLQQANEKAAKHSINTKGGGADGIATTDAAKHAINTRCAGCQDKVPTTEAAAKHAINTKGAGGDRTAADHAINTKGAGSGDRPITNPQTTLNPIGAFTVDNFPACAEGTSCNYVFTVEALNSQGNPVSLSAKPHGVRFGINWKTSRLYFEIY